MDADPLVELADAIHERGGLDVWFERPLEPHARRLMDTLGVRVHVEPGREPNGRLRSVPMQPCRADGCDTEVEGGRGLASYCGPHRREIAAKGRRGRPDVAPDGGGNVATSGTEVSLTDLVKRLANTTRTLEQTARRHRTSRGELRTAVQEFNDGLRELSAAAKRLLGDGSPGQ